VVTKCDLRNAPFVLLDDGRARHLAGYSLLFHNPDHIICADDFAAVPEALAKLDQAVAGGLHVAGWISYEVGAYFEQKLSPQITRKADEPLIWLMATKHREKLTSAELEELFHNAQRGNKRTGIANIDLAATSKPAYLKAIEAVKNYINAGDVYQVNHTFPVPINVEGDPLVLYQTLRQKQPVAYGAYIDTGTERILSLSPELFIEKSGGRLKAKPMKGTAARGRNSSEDEAASDFLKQDPKSKAENLMIVDLIRNDLSKISTPGTVQVENLFQTERYPTLHQMTSTVVSKAAAGLTPSTMLKAMFPCGSVTGAPKIRAMEIINELEDTPRGVYCGTIGHFSPQTDRAPEAWSLNVPIRTLTLKKPPTQPPHFSGRINIGAGIVADSDANAEYDECLLKASFLKVPTQHFDLIETILWSKGRYQLCDRHIERVAGSADFFGFAFDAESVRQCLAEHTEAFENQRPYRCRLLVARDGSCTVTSARLTDQAYDGQLGRQLPIPSTDLVRLPQTVSLAKEVTDPTDIFLHHKTTHRSLYNNTLKQAQAAGNLDALFFNKHGFLTEGAISSIFLVKNGVWTTPPTEDGLLPGIFRAAFIQRHSVSIASCRKADLLDADALYIANAVRGLRQVTLSQKD